MCGRYVVTNAVSKTQKIVKKAIKVKNIANYNAHPLQELPVIKKYLNGNTLESLRWGIVPKWAKKKNFRPLINARSETINEKISFKAIIKSSKCIVVADGYYEWKLIEKKKVPYFIFRKDKKPLFIAGIFANNEFCLVTENADGCLLDIHHRKPVIMNESDINYYLNNKNDAYDFIKNRNKPDFDFYKVSRDINKPTNNNPNNLVRI